MIVFIRRSVWLALALYLAATVSAESCVPGITNARVVTLDAAAIERYANTKTPFKLYLGKVQLEVTLSPAPVVPKEGLRVVEAADDGSFKETTVFEPTITYAGDVTGEDPAQSEVRFAIYGGIVDGYIYSKTGWWFIEPLSRFDPKAAASQYLVYTARDLDFAVPLDDDNVHTDEVIDYGGSSDGRIPIIMVADREYLDQVPDHFRERHRALVNAINGIYRDQLQREFKVVASWSDPHRAFLKSTDPATLIDELTEMIRSWGGIHQWGGELAHLTTGKDLDGNVAGQARFGERSVSEQRKTLAFRNMMLASHEIGHNFNAFHELADEWCVTEFVGICFDHVRDLMWPTFYNDNVPRFSDGTRNPMHNNVQQVDTNMRLRGFPRQPWL